MSDTNYIIGVIKILETPKQKMLKNNILLTKCRAQLPQPRTTGIVTLCFWGNLGRDVGIYYKINDYLIVEGHLFLRLKKSSNLMIQKLQKIELTVIRVYPFVLNSDSSIRKI
jgi:hypothetical protein